MAIYKLTGTVRTLRPASNLSAVLSYRTSSTAGWTDKYLTHAIKLNTDYSFTISYSTTASAPQFQVRIAENNNLATAIGQVQAVTLNSANLLANFTFDLGDMPTTEFEIASALIDPLAVNGDYSAITNQQLTAISARPGACSATILQLYINSRKNAAQFGNQPQLLFAIYTWGFPTDIDSLHQRTQTELQTFLQSAADSQKFAEKNPAVHAQWVTAFLASVNAQWDVLHPVVSFTRLLSGKLTGEEDSALTGMTIRLFSTGLSGEKSEAEVQTDDNGFFEITHTCDFKELDVVLRAYDFKENLIADSGYHFALEEKTEINLFAKGVFPSKAVAEEKFSALHKSLAGTDPDKMEANADYLAAKYEFQPELIKAYAAATRFVKEHSLLNTDGSALQLSFGMAVSGIELETKTLNNFKADELKNKLHSIVAEKKVPAVPSSAINTFNEGLSTALNRDFLKNSGLSAKIPLQKILGLKNIEPSKQERFAQLQREANGNSSLLWKNVQTDKLFTDTDRFNIRESFQLASIAAGYEPMLNQFKASGFTNLKSLAYQTKQDYLNIINGGVGLPEGVPGNTEEEKKNNYAAMICRMVEAAIPGEVVKGRVLADNKLIGHASISTFFNNAADFDLSLHSVNQYVKYNPGVLKGTASEKKAQYDAMIRLKRQYNLAPAGMRAESIAVLNKMKVDSAMKLARMGKEVFKSQFVSNGGSSDLAVHIYSNAIQLSDFARHLTEHFRPATDFAVTTAVNQSASAARLAGSPVFNDYSGVNLQDLFQSLDSCNCEQCASVYSPAAYLVELLEFLKKFRLHKMPNSEIILDELKRRRPDIFAIDLNCENAFTPVPYIDLVTEVLEDAVRNVSLMNSGHQPQITDWNNYQTQLNESELAALPEHIETETYRAVYGDILKNTIYYPWSLPFSLNKEESAVYLEYFGLTRNQLFHVNPAGVNDAFFVFDTLGLTAEEAELITIPETDLEKWKLSALKQWNYRQLKGEIDSNYDYVVSPPYSDFAARPVNSEKLWKNKNFNLHAFLHHSGLTETEFDDLRSSSYISPVSAANDRMKFGYYSLQPSNTNLTNLINFSQVAYYRLPGFVRLSKRTGISFYDLDLALRVLNPGIPDTRQNLISTDFLNKLAGVKTLKEKTGLTYPEVLSWFGNLDCGYVWDEGTSLYHQIFLSNSVSHLSAGINPFTLNAARTELANVQASTGMQGEIRTLISAALHISSAELDSLCIYTSFSGNRIPELSGNINLSNLSIIYRVVSLSRALRVSITQLYQMFEYCQISPAATANWSVQTLNNLMTLNDKLSELNLSFDQFFSLLRVKTNVEQEQETNDAQIKYRNLHVLLQRLLVGNKSTGNEDETGLQEKLHELSSLQGVAINPEEIQSQKQEEFRKIKLLLDSIYSYDEKNNLVPISLDLLKGFGFVDKDVEELNKLTLARQRYEYLHKKTLEIILLIKIRSTVVSWFAGEFQLRPEQARSVISLIRSDRKGQPDLAGYFADQTEYEKRISISPDENYPDQVMVELQSSAIDMFVQTGRMFEIAALFGIEPDEFRYVFSDSWFDLRLCNSKNVAISDRIPKLVSQLNTLLEYRIFKNNNTGFFSRFNTAKQEFGTWVNLLTDNLHTEELKRSIAQSWNQDITTVDLIWRFVSRVQPTDAFSRLKCWNQGKAIAELLSKFSISFSVFQSWTEDHFRFSQQQGSESSVQYLRSLVKMKMGDKKWKSESPKLRADLREKQRDALVAYLIAHAKINQDGPSKGKNAFKNIDDLLDHFLFDAGMNSDMISSRIRLALSTVQLFIQRCMLNIETAFAEPVEISADLRLQWEWMKNYRVWEANRKVFLYPENWLDPSLRKDKSVFFTELEQQLSQGELSKNNIESAFMDYLQKVDEVSNLEIMGICTDSDDGTVYVFGRTRELPHKYYFRKGLAETAGSKSGSSAPVSRWLAWDRIDLEIETEHLIPVVHHKRLFLFWATFEDTNFESIPYTISDNMSASGLDGNKDILHTTPENQSDGYTISMNWSRYDNGKWLKEKKAKQVLNTKKLIVKEPVLEFYKINGFELYTNNNFVVRFTGNKNASIEIRQLGSLIDLMTERILIRPSGSNTAQLHNEYIDTWGFKDKTDKLKVFRQLMKLDYIKLKSYFLQTRRKSNYHFDVRFNGSGELVFSCQFEYNKLKSFVPAQANCVDANGGVIHPNFRKLIYEDYLNATTIQINWENDRGELEEALLFDGITDPDNVHSDRIGAFVFTPEENVRVQANGLSSMRTGFSSSSHIYQHLKINTSPLTVSDVNNSNILKLMQNIPGENASIIYPANFTNSPSNLPPPYFIYQDDIHTLFFDVQNKSGIIDNPHNLSGEPKILLPSEFRHPFSKLLLKHAAIFGSNGVLNPQANLEFANTPEIKDELRELKKQAKSTPFYWNQFWAYSFVDNESTPLHSFDFSPAGSYSCYNWELFFHIPSLIAEKLNANQQFEEARNWYHSIFNPTAEADGHTDNRKYWQTKPFVELITNGEANGPDFIDILGSLESGNYVQFRSAIEAQISSWRKNPFDPDTIARIRIIAYMKSTVMKYITNLLNWGDHLYNRDTIESINEASQLYLMAKELLGERPIEVKNGNAIKQDLSYTELMQIDTNRSADAFSNFILMLEDQAGVYNQSSNGAAELIYSDHYTGDSFNTIPLESGSTSLPSPVLHMDTAYFCIPGNEKMLAYWDTVGDRLFKIRNSLNIKGIFRTLPLYEPPIDPELLIRARSLGVDLADAIDNLQAPLPAHRFVYLLQKAIEFTNDVKSFGSSLLTAIEKRDAENLSLLRSGHEIAMLEAGKEIRKLQLKESKENVRGLESARALAEAKLEYYSSRQFMNAEEAASMNLQMQAQFIKAITQNIYVLGSAASDAPQIATGALSGPAGGSIFWGETGGLNKGAAVAYSANAVAMYSDFLMLASSLAGTFGSYQRRKEDWSFQAKQAKKEIIQIEKQIAAAHIRQAIAEKEISNAELQISNSKESNAFMKSKFSNAELYDWMSRRISSLYFQSYQMAFDMAKRAEKAYQFERLDHSHRFVEYGYWDNLRSGLLAGEMLHHDLKRMELAYMDQMKRNFELSKHISIAMLNPSSLLDLKQNGECTFSLPEWLFDLDYPGHFKRKIKSVSVSILCVTGPYTSVNATLTMTKNRIRVKNSIDGNYAENANSDSDARFIYDLAAVQSIATSTGVNDSGMFELNFRDEKYMPFEGAGVISSWKLSLPNTFRSFDYNSISDIILHVKYTSLDGGEVLKERAAASIINSINDSNSGGLFRIFSLAHEFPNDWQMMKSGNGTLRNLETNGSHLPFAFHEKVNLKEYNVYDDKGEKMNADPIIPETINQFDLTEIRTILQGKGKLAETGTVFIIANYSTGI